jgi:LCP family protein required for cell wall assembly
MSEFREDTGDQDNREQPRRAGRRGATYAGASGSQSGQPGSQSGQPGSQSGQPGSQSERSGSRDPNSRDNERPYTLYRSVPRGLGARLRGETDAELEARSEQALRQQAPRAPRSEGAGGGRSGGPGGPGKPPRRGWRRIPGLGPSTRPPLHPLRLLRYILVACVAWVLLSAVLFFVSASTHSNSLPGGKATEAALTSAGPMLFTPNNILVVGLDNRPTSGYSSKEGGLSAADQNETDARTDTLMIWRVGGGVSRRLSIPRDTLVDLGLSDCGHVKINAAWVCGGPKETIRAVEGLTGLKINHMIVVDLGNFVKFIDDIGGVTVTTPRICSKISGGAADGGYTLNLAPGTHHLTGVQAVTLARTRENSCNLAYNDISREKMQQEIMNGIKSQLFSVHAFLHLPWAAWDAPRAIQTDMGGLDLMQLFISAEIGGSSKPQTLNETGTYYDGQDVLVPSQTDINEKVRQLVNGR